jgi:hypothetical protein
MENLDPDASTISRYVNLITVNAPTRPLAICLAALKFIGPIGGAPEERTTPPGVPADIGKPPGPPENRG